MGILVLVSCMEGPTKNNITWGKVVGSKENSATQIELFAEQFKWTVRYSGNDNTLGEFDYKLTTEINPLAIMTTEAIEASLFEIEYGENGINELQEKQDSFEYKQFPKDHDDINGELNRKERLQRLLKQMKKRHDDKIDVAALDDFILTDTLVLCIDQEYEFNFRSKDVIHSAYFPHFRAQMNTVPGMITRFKYTPAITTEEMRRKESDAHFEYMLMCNKICGTGHYSMKMIVRVLEKEEYDSWVLSKSANSFEKTVDTMKHQKSTR